jgi:hypothetical protein
MKKTKNKEPSFCSLFLVLRFSTHGIEYLTEAFYKKQGDFADGLLHEPLFYRKPLSDSKP